MAWRACGIWRWGNQHDQVHRDGLALGSIALALALLVPLRLYLLMR